MEEDSFDAAMAAMEMPELPPVPKVMKITTEVSVKYSSSNSILVNTKQKGNPLLKSINNIPWEFDESIVPDYVVGKTACVLFLSIRYHQLKPDYIQERLKMLGKMYELRILLVQVDTKVSRLTHRLKFFT